MFDYNTSPPVEDETSYWFEEGEVHPFHNAVGSPGDIFEREGSGILNEILEEIETSGYEVQAYSYPASLIGACHKRERIFIVAHTNKIGCDDGGFERERVFRSEQTRDEGRERSGDASNSSGSIDKPRSARAVKRRMETEDKQTACDAPDLHIQGSQRRDSETSGRWQPETGFGLRDAGSWPEVAARLCRVDDGAPSRVDRLRCLGNAVVPQQIYPILKAIADIEKGA
jgi:DNA (cytosine-5)-methyltransferase 1